MHKAQRKRTSVYCSPVSFSINHWTEIKRREWCLVEEIRCRERYVVSFVVVWTVTLTRSFENDRKRIGNSRDRWSEPNGKDVIDNHLRISKPSSSLPKRLVELTTYATMCIYYHE